jgi:methyltransferase
MGGSRLVELAVSRRNVRAIPGASEGEWSRRTYPLMVALHAVVIAGTAARGADAPRIPWLALLLALQPPRAWVLGTLGRRWNTRAAVPGHLEVETGGPYRFVRHPNYTVVFLELLALPMAFRLPVLALAGTTVNAALLAVRIRDEEKLLFGVPGYREYAHGVPRFLPPIFR